MRISCDKADAGYDQFIALGGHDVPFEFYCDGDRVECVVTADTGAGFLIVLDEKAIQPGMSSCPRAELRGHVKIMLNGAVLASSPIPTLDASPDGGDAVAYLAIRIKASERIECSACGSLDGHDCDCPMGFIERMLDGQEALERGEGVALRIEARPVAFGDPAKSGGIVEGENGQRFRITGSSAWVGEDGVRREMPEFERVRIDMPPSHEMGKLRGILGCSVASRSIAEAADKAQRAEALERLGVSEDDLRAIREEMRPLTADDFNAILGKPRRSKVAAMMAARRARKRKMLTPEAEGVHRAISAMQKPGRAHEL